MGKTSLSGHPKVDHRHRALLCDMKLNEVSEPDQDWNTHVYNCPGAGKPEQTGHCSLMSVKSLSIVFKIPSKPISVIQACYYCELILVSYVQK